MHRLRFVALALTLAACGDVESPIVTVVPVGSFEGRVENGELVSLRMLSGVEATAADEAARLEQGRPSSTPSSSRTKAWQGASPLPASS